MRDPVSNVTVVLRSGRHLTAAVAALRSADPRTRVVVVAQPGTDAELAAAGVAAADRIVYRGGRFSPVRFFFSRAFWRARACRPRRVAVLWNDPEGSGLRNVTRTGLLLGVGRILPVTPTVVRPEHSWWDALGSAIGWRVAAAGDGWDRLRERVEGPELEPRVWHSHFLTVGPHAHVLRELAGTLRGRVLDIGAGTGYAERFLDPRTTRYLPTDLPTGRDSANVTLSRRGMAPHVYCVGERLPFRDRSVDAVVSFSVLEHVLDVPGILRDAHRVLRPGGRVLIATPFYFLFHGEPNDYRRWTVHGLAAELRACGFEVEEIRRIGSSLTSLILNLHLVVKCEWRTAESPVLRFISRWAWPPVLIWQAAANLAAVAIERLEPESRMPLGVVIRAVRP